MQAILRRMMKRPALILPLMAALALPACVPVDQAVNQQAGKAARPVASTPQQARQPVTRQPAARQPAAQKPIVIADNRGGNVLAMIQRRNELERWGGPVEIRGYCGSACTMLITLPNACLGPNASVGFHAPRLPGTTIIPPHVDAIMANYYRNGIKARWNREWKHSLEIRRISAREYVRLDPQTRLCAV